MSSPSGAGSGSTAALDLLPPAHLWVPAYEHTNGDIAAEVGELVGLVPDVEQRLVLNAMYAEKAPGVPLVFSTCVVAPRQNLKTACYQIGALTDAYVFADELIVWTAHLFDTARKAFLGLVKLIESTPDFDQQTKNILRGRGDEAIELLNGSRIEFHARSTKGGRGFTGNKVFLDEALFLDPGDIGALYPTMATIPGAQARLASSAGVLASQVLRDYRDRGRAGGDPTLAYFEWGARLVSCELGEDCTHLFGTAGCALDRVDLLEEANSALRRERIQLVTLQDFRRNMPPAEYMREFFTWWEDPTVGAVVIPLDVWGAQAADPPAGKPTGFAVDMTPDRGWTSIGVYCDSHVDVVEHKHGSSWVVEACTRLWKRHKVPFAIDPKGPAANIIDDLQAAGVEVLEPKPVDVVRACADFYDAIVDGRLWQCEHLSLDAAVAGAKKRDVGDGWAWDRKKGAVISPLVAVTLARWAAVKDDDYDVLDSIL
jgi:hypothetical protein